MRIQHEKFFAVKTWMLFKVRSNIEQQYVKVYIYDEENLNFKGYYLDILI